MGEVGAVFLLFLYSVKMKNLEKSIKALLMGAVVFIFFAPSGFFTLKPIIMQGVIPYIKSNKSISFNPIDILFSDINLTTENYDSCHDQEDFLMGGLCTSLELNALDILGKWRLQPNRYENLKGDIKKRYEESYFVLEANGSVEFHAFYAKGDYGCSTMNYLDTKGKWQLHSKKNDTHPFISIKNNEGVDIIFYFDSESTLADGLYLKAQFDDPDAPHFLNFKRKIFVLN